MTTKRVRDDSQSVRVEAADAALQGDLGLPLGAQGIVLFAHDSASSRKSPRNRAVAGVIRGHGVGTLLFDLLTPAEERADARTGEHRFDIELLASRLAGATAWVGEQERTRGLAVGYFGASTGGAAALVAAARESDFVHAVVSCGGRPDLAGESLASVRAPTLLLVGGEDRPTPDVNRRAFDALRCEKDLVVIPGATHLFEEPGTLEEVARHAAAWFERHLAE